MSDQTASAPNTTKPKTPKKAKLINLQNFNVGLLTALLVQPFEVIRTSSIMSLKNMDNSILGTWKVMGEIWRLEGIKGFFRGGVSSLGKSALGAGVFFTGLENVHVLTEGLRDYRYIPDNLIDFFNASCSRVITTLCVNPITVVKTRFEVVGNNQYTSIPHAVMTIFQKDGLRGFYKGILPTLMRDVPYSGLQYSSYRFLMESWSKYVSKERSPYESPLIVSSFGAASAIFAVMLTYPFDNMRVRFQCHDLVTNPQHLGVASMARQIYREEGIKGFYLGYLPRLMKKGFSSGLSWVVYEKLRKDTALH